MSEEENTHWTPAHSQPERAMKAAVILFLQAMKVNDGPGELGVGWISLAQDWLELGGGELGSSL